MKTDKRSLTSYKKLLPFLLVVRIIYRSSAMFVNFLSFLGFLAVWLFQVLFDLIFLPIKSLNTLILHLLPKKRGRGRPRSRPFKEYVAYRFKPILHWLKLVFPKPVRIGLAAFIIFGVVFYYS